MKFLDYIFASRPLLHLPVWSIYLISLHDYDQSAQGAFGVDDLLLLIILSLIVAAAYFLNQLVDFRSDLINDKVGFLQRGLITPERIQLAAIICAVAALAASATFPLRTMTLVAQGILGAILYSMPPFSLMKRPIMGLLVNAYMFGWLVPVIVAPHISLHDIAFPGWGSPLFFLFAVASTHVMTTIPDIKGDREAGKKTIAVLIGERPARAVALILLLMAAVVAFWFENAPLSYIAIISSITLIYAMIVSNPRMTLLATKLPILLITLLAGFYYPAYLLFIVVLIVAARVYYAKRFGILYPRLG